MIIPEKDVFRENKILFSKPENVSKWIEKYDFIYLYN